VGDDLAAAGAKAAQVGVEQSGHVDVTRSPFHHAHRHVVLAQDGAHRFGFPAVDFFESSSDDDGSPHPIRQLFALVWPSHPEHHPRCKQRMWGKVLRGVLEEFAPGSGQQLGDARAVALDEKCR
jgi:hypothetical protein